MKERDLYCDGLKFIMICLVVFGHITHPDYNEFVATKFIYAFHMPVFVFLSGYFSSAVADMGKFIKMLAKLLCVYVVTQIVLNLISFAIGNELTLTRMLCLTPRFTLWYVFSLVIWRIMLRLVVSKLNLWLTFAGSVGLALLAGFVPIDLTFAFQRVFAFMPFFLLGYIFREYKLMSRLETISELPFIAIFVIGLFAAIYLPIYMPELHYAIVSDILVRAMQTLLGFALCLSVVRMSRCGYVKCFAKYGRHTLWIYIGHTIMITIQNPVLQYWGITMNPMLAVFLSTTYVLSMVALAQGFGKLCKRI